MTEAMPFLRNTILLSYDTHSLRAGVFLRGGAGKRRFSTGFAPYLWYHGCKAAVIRETPFCPARPGR